MRNFKIGDRVIVTMNGWNIDNIRGIVVHVPDGIREYYHVTFNDMLGLYAFTGDEIEIDKNQTVINILNDL